MDQREASAPARPEIPAPKTGGNGSAASAGAPAATEQKGRPGLRIVLYVVAGLALIAGLLWGVKYLAYASTHQSTDDARVDADQVVVTSKIAERVARILVDTNQQVKKGQPLIQLDDRDEREKLLAAIAARDAQLAQAKAAQANVALTRDTQSAQNSQNSGGVESAAAQIASAQSQYASSQGQVNVAQAQVETANAQLRAAEAALPAARAAVDKADADLARTRSLVASGDLARSQLDSAASADAAARSQLREAQANVSAAQTSVLAARERVDQNRSSAQAAQAIVAANQGQLQTARGKLAESGSAYKVAASQATADAALSQVNSLEAQVKTARDLLSYTRIAAPSDGYVGQKSVEAGQTVAPGASLLTLIPLDRVYVTANFKETQIGQMKPGQPVDIAVDAYKGTDFHGHVQAINPASENTYSLVPAQNATGNFVKVTQRIPVRIAIDNPDPNKPLRPGMSVEASVKVK